VGREAGDGGGARVPGVALAPEGGPHAPA
jgi:hypothetical protein